MLYHPIFNAIKRLHKAAEERGIDLNAIMKETDHEAYREKQSFRDTTVKTPFSPNYASNTNTLFCLF